MKKIDIERVVVTDLSDYDPDLCCTGGKYAYYTEYARQADGLWTVSYDTSSDFEFCPCCGRFGCDECDEYEHISTSEMLERLAEDAAHEGVTIECYNSRPEQDDEEKLIVRDYE